MVTAKVIHEGPIDARHRRHRYRVTLHGGMPRDERLNTAPAMPELQYPGAIVEREHYDVLGEIAWVPVEQGTDEWCHALAFAALTCIHPEVL